jgi:hypothetical protein
MTDRTDAELVQMASVARAGYRISSAELHAANRLITEFNAKMDEAFGDRKDPVMANMLG